jgi:hypothetical protein
MTDEYDGVEKQYLIRDAEMASKHYEEQAELCLPGIFDGSGNAYAIARYFAALVDAYQTKIIELKQSENTNTQK